MGLWEEHDGEQWLDNPRRKRGGTKRRRRAGTKRRRRRAVASAAPRTRKRRGGRRRRRFGIAARRRFGRAARGVGGSIMSRLTDGLKGGVGVVAGKVVVRSVPRMVGLPGTGYMGLGVQAGLGVLAAPFVDKFLPGFGKPFLYGAFASVIESLAVQQNIPVVAPALSSYGDELSALPTVPARMISSGGMSAYGNPALIAEEEDALVQ